MYSRDKTVDGAMSGTVVLRFAKLFLSSILLLVRQAAGYSTRLAHVPSQANQVKPGL
jgi:hypothetical protein